MMSWGSGPLTSPGSWSAQCTQPFSPQAPLWCSRKHLVAVSLSLFYFCQQEEEVGGGKEAGGIRAWLPS